MKNFNSIIIILFILIYPAYSKSRALTDIYIQQDDHVINLNQAIIRDNGSIVHINNTSKYLLITNKKRVVIDITSLKSIQDSIGILYQDRTMIKIIFLHVKPNKKAYMDSSISPFAIINKSGNAEAICYLSPGTHIINLRNLVHIVESGAINVYNAAIISNNGLI